MAPLASSADFLTLEFTAGNRRVLNAVFASLSASLSYSPAVPRTSQRLRQALVLRALDAALHTEAESGGASSCSCSRILLRKAREVLADPDFAACFPHQITVNVEDDEASAAAKVADPRRLLDLEWANLPPSMLERDGDRIAGDGSHQTLAAAADPTKRTELGLLVGESIERETSAAKLVKDGSDSDPPVLAKVTDNVSNGNEADGAARDDEVPCPKLGAHGQVPEKSSVHASKKRNLMERNPNLDDSDDLPVRKRSSPPERKSYPSTSAQKIRKKFSEIEEKILLEGAQKYGKSNWKDIKLAYPDVFGERSTVDLKDKFRNLERNLERNLQGSA